MITRFITEVKTRFNPFSAQAKSARLFLSFLPPTARSQGMAITTQLLPRASTEPSSLLIKFSTLLGFLSGRVWGRGADLAHLRMGGRLELGQDGQTDGISRMRIYLANLFLCVRTEDGKEMKLDCEAMGIKSIVEEVDRHSRMLQKEADLAAA